MNAHDNQLSRRRFLQASAAVGAAVSLGGFTAACNAIGGGAAQGGTFNWMTWGDHYIDTQLKAIEASDKIVPQISELAGNAEGFAKLKEVKGELDQMSGDALWVPDAYFAEGLIDAVRHQRAEGLLAALSVRAAVPDLDEARGLPRLSVRLVADQHLLQRRRRSAPAPDSWEVLLDPKYKGRIVIENQPEEIVAYMGKASGVDDVYNMTDDQLATVKGLLEQLKPNVLKFAQQATDSVNSMISEEAWLITGNLGNEDRVKDGGGPEIKGFIPKEGTVGWMDAEMIVKDGKNKSLLFPFMEKSQQAENIAENFITHGRPLFNEAAYKVLVDGGNGDRADRYLLQQGRGDPRQDDVEGPWNVDREVDPALQRGLRSLVRRHGDRDRRRGRCGPADGDRRARGRADCVRSRRSFRPGSSSSACSSCPSP